MACRISIRGVVQGVGFRPFVYRLATKHDVAGWICNDETGVEIHAEADRDQLEAFSHELRSAPPPAASITEFEIQPTACEGFSTFQIRDSLRASAPSAGISPDLALCEDCLREMTDSTDRRFHYPYINCTNCGPRYSILKRLPYDRPNTTMEEWTLCPQCRREYEDPLDRRHHAQPTACEVCGPGYRLQEGSTRLASSEAAIRRTAELLRTGGIVGIKGIGGYHLACDARNAETVRLLRERKFRKEKPFAVMVRSLEEARDLIEMTPLHARLLLDVARPIVLAPSKVFLPGVAPDNDSLGVMLAYAPLHHLLFDCGAPSPLVLTSGNRSSEPIAYRDDDAIERLAGIADAFLIGDRPIARRVDDSVVTVRRDQPFMLRRSRRYAPGTVCRLPTDQPILALGGDLKNAIALVVRGQVLVSQFIGDLGEFETNRSFEETVHDLLDMYDIRSNELTVVHDLHPQFVSTQFADLFPARRRVAVQHHHAHIASVLAEHQRFDETVIGIAFDGTGYGKDGTIWGGEFFVGSICTGFERVASLQPVRMPGGDSAARFPVQAAAGFLAGFDNLPDMAQPPFSFPNRFSHALQLVKKDVRCFTSTSMGRLFDAVAALLGFVRDTLFEGQAAIWLEHQAQQCPQQSPYPFPSLDHRPLFESILHDHVAGRPVPEIASAFHSSVAAATVAQARAVCEKHSLRTVAVSGGVFQNELLFKLISDEFDHDSPIELLTNRQIPANDGGLSVGQAAVAALGCGFDSVP